jgi:hypothetical protein
MNEHKPWRIRPLRAVDDFMVQQGPALCIVLNVCVDVLVFHPSSGQI